MPKLYIKMIRSVRQLNNLLTEDFSVTSRVEIPSGSLSYHFHIRLRKHTTICSDELWSHENSLHKSCTSRGSISVLLATLPLFRFKSSRPQWRRNTNVFHFTMLWLCIEGMRTWKWETKQNYANITSVHKTSESHQTYFQELYSTNPWTSCLRVSTSTGNYKHSATCICNDFGERHCLRTP